MFFTLGGGGEYAHQMQSVEIQLSHELESERSWSTEEYSYLLNSVHQTPREIKTKRRKKNQFSYLFFA